LLFSGVIYGMFWFEAAAACDQARDDDEEADVLVLRSMKSCPVLVLQIS